MDEKKKLLRSKTPIQVITKMLNKRKRNRSVNQPHTIRDESESRKEVSHGPRQARSNDDLLSTSYGDHMNEIVLIERELELLHMSRVDNPYLQVLSSQDGLDRDYDSPEPVAAAAAAATLAASPTRSHGGCAGGARTPLVLEEIHSHLVRSPPPVSWPATTGSPRSTGTFSPDSGAEMTMSSGDERSSEMVVKRNSAMSPPGFLTSSSGGGTGGGGGQEEMRVGGAAQVAVGINPLADRSQSFDHILSPCKELLKTAAGGGGVGSSALLSPVRGATPDLLLNDSGYYGSSVVSQATSPRYMSTSVGANDTAWFSRQRSFHVHQQGQAAGAAAATAGQQQRRMPFYHTMSMYSTNTQTDDNCNTTTMSHLDQNSFSQSVLSPQPVVRTSSFSSSNILRRSFGRLPSALFSPITATASSDRSDSRRSSSTGQRGDRMFCSWRKSTPVRIRSKSSDTAAFLDGESPADDEGAAVRKRHKRATSKKSTSSPRRQTRLSSSSTDNLLAPEKHCTSTARSLLVNRDESGEHLLDPPTVSEGRYVDERFSSQRQLRKMK